MVLSILSPEDLEALLERAIIAAIGRIRDDELLTTDAVARIAKRSPKTVRRWIRVGRLPARRSGRSLVVLYRDLKRLLHGQPAHASADEILKSL